MIGFILIFLFVAVVFTAIYWANEHNRKARKQPGYCPVCDRKMNRERQC